MSKALSLDLGYRVIQAISEGKSRRSAARQFSISAATAVRLQKRLEETGSVKPLAVGRPRNSGKLGPYRESIIAKVEAQPDITMRDLASWLYEREGVKVDASSLSRLLCKAGFSYKKNTFGNGEKARRC